MRTWLAFSLLSWLLGCAPSMRGLIAGHHYREAICATDEWPAELDRVGRALDADAGLVIQVYALHPSELEPLLGSATGSVTDRARFLRIALQTNALPVDEFEIVAQITDGHRGLSDSLDRTTLSQITQEPVPHTEPPHTELRPLGGLVLDLLRYGFWRLIGVPIDDVWIGIPQNPVQVEDPDIAYRIMAPHAHALFHAMGVERPWVTCSGDSGSVDGLSVRCSRFVAVPPRGAETARLEVLTRYKARRQFGAGHGGYTCTVERTAIVDLGPLDQLDATVDRMFGPAMHAIPELTEAPAVVR